MKIAGQTSLPDTLFHQMWKKFERLIVGLTSAHWGVYEFAVKNGRITEMKPFAEDPDPSPIGPSIIDLLDDPMHKGASRARELAE